MYPLSWEHLAPALHAGGRYQLLKPRPALPCVWIYLLERDLFFICVWCTRGSKERCVGWGSGCRHCYQISQFEKRNQNCSCGMLLFMCSPIVARSPYRRWEPRCSTLDSCSLQPLNSCGCIFISGFSFAILLLLMLVCFVLLSLPLGIYWSCIWMKFWTTVGAALALLPFKIISGSNSVHRIVASIGMELYHYW